MTHGSTRGEEPVDQAAHLGLVATGTLLRARLDQTVRLTAGVRADVATLSNWYRSPGGPRGLPPVRDFAAAYAAYRMPATFHAAAAAMRAAAELTPDYRPRSMLDVGAGPGSAIWAAAATWPSLVRAQAVERDGPSIDLGRDLAAHSGVAVLVGIDWTRADATTNRLAPADLVTASYLVGELDPEQQERAVDRLWDLTAGLLVIVEPGTPRGADRIRLATRRLINGGAAVLAPCPGAECPATAAEWCHFSVRLERSRLHRRAKQVELDYEDEKFAYVVAARDTVPSLAAAGRVVSRPRRAKGRVELRLCTPSGLVTRMVARSEGDAYKLARKLEWGSLVPQELASSPRGNG